MASSSKKPKSEENDEISCYLHLVSPVKLSQKGNNYFNAVVQEPTGFTNMVCFSNNAQRVQKQMQEFEKTKSPVTLKNVERCVSTREAGKFDLKFNSKSQLLGVKRQLHFRFEPPAATADTITIDETSTINPYQKVTVKAKVLNKDEISTQTIKSGEQLNMQNITIADNSNTITLVIWKDDIEKIKIGTSYLFKNITVRMYDNIKSLTTSPDSSIEEIEDIGPVKVHDPLPTFTEVEILISSASCHQTNCCNSCFKDIGTYNTDLPTVKCPHCAMRQKTEFVQKSFRCDIQAMIENNQRKLNLSNAVISNCPQLAQLTTADQLEDFFIMNPKLLTKMTTSKTHILSIVQIL